MVLWCRGVWGNILSQIVMKWLFYLLWIIFDVMGGYERKDVESIRN